MSDIAFTPQAPMRRLVYAWEGEVEGLHEQIKRKDAEIERLREAIDAASKLLGWKEVASPELEEAHRVFKAALTASETERATSPP